MSRTLLLDALAGKSTQRNVWGTGTSIACRELMDRVGAYLTGDHLDAEKMFYLAAAGYTVLGFDVVMPLFSACRAAAALGCKDIWGSVDMMPEIG